MKVIIADNDELMCSLLEYWAHTETSAEIVGGVSSGNDVVDLVKENGADLLVIDPMISGKPGFGIVRELRREKPETRMIALYGFDKPFLVDMMRKVGFHGCVSKRSNSLAKLRQAVISVMGGNAYYCAETCRILNSLYTDPASYAQLLSLREQEVLCFIAEGLDNEKIGEKLKLSPATVQTHRRNLFRKLEIHDTPSLMRYAIQQGFSSVCIGDDFSMY